MVEETILYIILMWVAVFLSVSYVFPKVKRRHPQWEGRAEFASSFAGLIMLFLLSSLAIPGATITWTL